MESSSSQYDSCRFDAFWKPFIRIFQFLCMSHFSVFRKNLNANQSKKWFLIIYYFIFDTFHIWTITYLTILGLEPKSQIKKSPLMYYVQCMGVYCNFLTHLTSHVETLLKGKYEVAILDKFREINRMLSVKLHHEIDFNSVRKHFFAETFLVFLLSSLLPTLAIFTSSNITGISDNVRFLHIYEFFILYIRGFQIAMMLNFMNYCLRQMQILLKRQQCDQQTTLYPLKYIRYYRDIYSNIWLIKNLISDCYGWSLISLLVQFTLILINLPYWIYVNFKVFNSSEFSIRMYAMKLL